MVARPLLNLFYPELSGIIQPLSGEYAGRRVALESMPFFTGYGVGSLGALRKALRMAWDRGRTPVDYSSLVKALPEKKQAAVRDRLAKARTQLKAQEGRLADIAEALTPERMPKRESEGMTLMQALRKKGGVTPEMARDMGIDAKDSKTVNKKGLADENQIEFALDDLDMLRPGEKYADVIEQLYL